jgi:hypothetical protein
MIRKLLCCIPLLLVAGAVQGEEPEEKSDKLLSGMSIVGNDEAPKSLVIVPWKTSELGHTLDVSKAQLLPDTDGVIGSARPRYAIDPEDTKYVMCRRIRSWNSHIRS